jgi:hypothetical protein
MHTPPSISFVHMEPSFAAETTVRDLARWLERFDERITTCHVVMDGSDDRDHMDVPCSIRIDIGVPEGTITVHHYTSEREARSDIYIALVGAFASARRVLEVHARTRRQHLVAARAGTVGRHGIREQPMAP